RKEVIFRQLAREGPDDLLKRGRPQFIRLYLRRKKTDLQRAAIWIFVLDAGNRRRAAQGCAELLAQFPRQSLLGRLTRFDLAAGKLPFERRAVVRAALPDQHAAVRALDNCGYHLQNHFLKRERRTGRRTTLHGSKNELQ